MMEILLDTHIFLWWSLEPAKLPPTLLAVLKNPDNRIVFSTVSAWEATIKIGLGKLELTEPLRTIVDRELAINHWEVLPVQLAHTWRLVDLPPLHKDPFDRLLVAQALTEGLIIATRDPLVRIYPGLRTIWDGPV